MENMAAGHRPHVSCLDAKSRFQSSGTSSRVDLCVCPRVYHQFFFVFGSLSGARFIEHMQSRSVQARTGYLMYEDR